MIHTGSSSKGDFCSSHSCFSTRRECLQVEIIFFVLSFFDAIKLTWSWSSSARLLRSQNRTETSGLREGSWKGWCISIRDRKLKAEEE